MYLINNIVDLDQNQNLSKDKIEDQTGLSNSKIQKDNKDIKE